jgi:hypothetical protein
MTLSVSLHDPASATSQRVSPKDGRASFGVVRFTDADGERVSIFTTPEIAAAVADAFNAAFAAQREGVEA